MDSGHGDGRTEGDLESYDEQNAANDEVSLTGLYREVLQLREALETRDVIAQAKGMIRLLTQCQDAQAFEVLRIMSNHHNLKLGVVSELVAESGATGRPLPDALTPLFAELLAALRERNRSENAPRPIPGRYAIDKIRF